MNIRHAGYELRPYNDSCWLVYRVMPEGYDNSSSKLRLAEDGRALKSMEKYPVGIAEGLRIMRRLVAADGGGTEGLDAAVARVEEADRRFGEMAREIEREVVGK